ncbi:MAG: hypothetical protein M0C28_41915 [Candidatus Moduliflexus flocculans]|nr:hypothetical protein [Candidatus Moduliflexus flocculans]
MNAGTTWEPIFDTLRLGLHRRRRLLPEGPQHHLGRHGRGMRPQQRRLGRRRLQVDRRRQDLRPHGPRDDPDDRPGPDPPDRPEHRLRRRLGPPLGLHRRPRPVQDGRRRHDLDQARRRPARTTARPGPSTWSCTRPTPRPSTSPSGSASASPGASTPAARTAASSRRPTAARPGPSSPRACPRASSAASAWPSPAPTRTS